MSSSKNRPPHNYAKPVEKFPQFRQQVNNVLTNQFGRDSVGNSNFQSNDKIYLILHNNVYYKGQWKKGLPNGKGICIYSDGTYCEGKFQDGQIEDKDGFLILPNGATYRGNITRSIIEGKGKMKHNQGSQGVYYYDGEWKDGRPHGYGVEKYGDGGQYEGYFQYGLKHCFDGSKLVLQKAQEYHRQNNLRKQSKYQSGKNGQIYIGQFYKGLMHGFGDYYNVQKHIRYTGQFQNGTKKGYGKMEAELGTLYGHFENDVIDGQGKFEWNKKDGRVYEGNFKDSKFHGPGNIILPNGNILQGQWQNGHSIELQAVKSNNF